VALELFEVGAAAPLRRLALERDGSAAEPWSLFRGAADGLPERFEYTVHVDGGPPLVDPYAPALAGGETWGRSDDLRGAGVGRRYRGLFLDLARRAGEAAPPAPRVRPGERVIYELHVRGFTRHPSSKVAHPGTYLGLIEKIPYLVSLGVTTVELLPLFEFDETENPRRNPSDGSRLLNFWGYSPVSFFAPKAGYAADPTPGAAAAEMRLLIDELHRAGLEVVLDVVYNHTAEGGGGAGDPLLSLRGLDARAYYLHDEASGKPLDFTGCGNTVAADHPVTRRLIVDSLRHWVSVYGVDGFRFDLAGFFYRGAGGRPLERPATLEAIGAEPELAGRLLVAEPWDVTGFTPVAGFPRPWLEWNGRFRDDVRRLVRGERVERERMALRLAGSPERFAPPRSRHHAVDFVTCHDGFTLADLVAYERKHNQANGEGNRDGSDHNLSWNCGVEGESSDPKVAALRARQIANLLVLLAATGGTPMLLGGDEGGRSQRGNNNAWCQDNEVSWLDWSRVDGARAEMVRRLLGLRRELAANPRAEVAMVAPYAPPGTAPAATLWHFPGAPAFAVAVNAGESEVRFPLPAPAAGRSWSLAADSARAEPVPVAPERPALAGSELALAPRSVRVLVAG